jgi:DNA processing protein
VPARVPRRLRRPDAARLRSRPGVVRGGRRHLVRLARSDYPPLLRAIVDPPVALFVEGDPALLWQPSSPSSAVAAPRPAARHRAPFRAAFAAAASAPRAAGRGHRRRRAPWRARSAGADGRRCVATGLDIVFPRANAALARHIGEAGAIVSEHPAGRPPRAGQFPARNRIIAGLALGHRGHRGGAASGALITARLAGDAGREVFAVPGSIHNPMAQRLPSPHPRGRDPGANRART